MAAIVIFVGTGSAVLSQVRLGGNAINRALLIALLLNIALILFGWRRHQRIVSAAVIDELHAGQLATRDPLTQLLNRRSFVEQGAAVMAQAVRRGKTAALVLLDLDHFRHINDTYGAATGDAVLGEVARIFTDSLPPATVIARTDGDEFAALLVFDPGHAEPIDRAIERIIAQLAEPLMFEGFALRATVSIGVGHSEQGAGSVDTLMRRAAIALGAAKARGRARALWFDAAMEQMFAARDDIETGLRTALSAGQIVPYFDQQIDLASGALAGFEVLARWQHPSGRLIAAAEFLGVAEQARLAELLSMAVLQQALAQARDWDAGLALSVNLTATQLSDPWFAQKLVKLLGETGFPAARLEVEITEAALFDTLDVARATVASLKSLGVRLVLDDFGTGYSSLAHLRALPFDRLKIDHSFVAAIDDSAEAAAIVTAIAGLGASLNIPVTAEGIADAAAEDRLRALGCRQGQGQHYGAPMSAAATRVFLAQRGLIQRHGAAPAARTA